MNLEEEIVQLRTENQRLREQIVLLEQRIIELEQGDERPPALVKPNKPKGEGPKAPRRKRQVQHNHGRKREMRVTYSREHAWEHCPDCGYRLRGRSVARRRQVIDLPAPQAVEVTEHVVIKRQCPRCRGWKSPKLDLRGQVLGQGRVGVRLASLIGYLRTTLRLPYALIQSYLQSMHQVWLSIGELVEVLHHLVEVVQPALEQLRSAVRGSALLNADESGWREEGHNGYVWAFSTPGEQGVRYYEYDRHRDQGVVQRVLGEEFQGVLSTDFYSAYNVYRGRHQRCWVHLLRDLHTLKEEQAQNAEIVLWAQAVRSLYEQAQGFLQGLSPPTQEERERRYVALVAEVDALGLLYAQQKKHPCQALAKRLLRHEDELFQFVLVPGLSADNNLAERSLRPVVVMRKISGGTRSARGSKTRMALASLFGTWQARGLNPLSACVSLLCQTPLPQI
jgi:transposase